MNERIFTLKDQQDFSRLSGDYNPLHIDPVLSRRLLFGQTVVHGIHAFLWGIEQWIENKNEGIHFDSINTQFVKPIFLNKLLLLKSVYL